MEYAKLLYYADKTPAQNLYDFCVEVDTLRYEWVENTFEGRTTYYLNSAWQNEAGMREITLMFQKSFMKHLAEISLTAADVNNYPLILKECKDLLRTANHRFSTNIANILILTKPSSFPLDQCIVKYDSLPESYRIMIYNCYQLLVVFFRNLTDCIEEETRDNERTQYIIRGTSYQWLNDKNDLSELALAIFESGAFTRNGKKLIRTTFVRDFAAFFGVNELHFDQDIVAMMTRTHGSKTEFLDSLPKRVQEYFTERIDNED